MRNEFEKCSFEMPPIIIDTYTGDFCMQTLSSSAILRASLDAIKTLCHVFEK